MTQPRGPQEPQSLAEALAQLRDPDPRLRTLAAKALGRQGTDVQSAVPSLLTALGDPDPMVRSMAASALGRIGGEGALEGLLQAVADPVLPVRFWAAEALGRLRVDTPAVRQALAALAEEPDVRLRTAAQRALQALGPAARSDGTCP